jgi:hypothetical protein
MRNSDYYLPAVGLAIAFVVKLPALRRGWREPLVRSVHFLLFTAAICFFFAAPPTIIAVNRITGVPNISGPLVYCIMSAFSCACLVLINNWRGGPADRVRRRSRWWIAAYGTAVTALPVLFALGDAPEERLRDLDTYYANTPYIREMVVLYLLAHTVAALVTTAMCLRWARVVGQWLRAGLLVLVLGFLLNLGFGVTKLAAVAARWNGRDWDWLSSSAAPPLAAAGGLITTAGFLLPLLGPQAAEVWRAWLHHLRLGPLWRRLRPPDGGAPMPGIPWWASPELRLTVRETVIHDELLRLQPYLDDRVRQDARDRAVRGRLTDDQASLVGVAAMVDSAVAARRGAAGPADPRDADEETRTLARAGTEALTEALGPGRERLVRLSAAFRSPYLPAPAAGPGSRAGRPVAGQVSGAGPEGSAGTR